MFSFRLIGFIQNSAGFQAVNFLAHDAKEAIKFGKMMLNGHGDYSSYQLEKELDNNYILVDSF